MYRYPIIHRIPIHPFIERKGDFMYPYDIAFGVGLYEICIVLGLILAMVVFRILADRARLSAKMQNMCLVAFPVALATGYLAAVVFQWFYNGIRDGKFAESIFASSTGSTFYGGLIGGTSAVLIFYFAYGHFAMKNKEHVRAFPKIFDIAPSCITLAHALGRIGCFFAGCCYGKPTSAFFGVMLKNVDHKVIPTQLFEALFLLILFAFLTVRFYDGKRHQLPIYLMSYGVWRFMIEFLRGDDRGETVVSFLSPSQLTAVILFIVGIVLLFLVKYIYALEGVTAAPTKDESESEAPESKTEQSE